MKRLLIRTANSAALRLSALITKNAPNISTVNDGEWYVIAPLGEFPSPDGTYIQVVNRDQANKIISTWNSIPGTAARMFKNMWHGLGAKFSTPVFDGHPETNKARWPITRLLAETTDLRVTENALLGHSADGAELRGPALEGKQTWNEKGNERRTRGPLYPSPLWWHLPPNEERKVFPELLESIGLVPTPNISSVPAWTQNASPEATTNQEKENTMLEKLRKALGLGATATEDEVVTAVETRVRTANAAPDRSRLIEILSLAAEATNEKIFEAITGLKATANAFRKKITTALGLAENAADDQIDQALASVRSTANSATALTTTNAALVDGILDLLEKSGKITPAQRPDVKARFTANDAKPADIVKELLEKKPQLNTKEIQLNNNRVDVSTANARQAALEDAIQKKMADLKTDDRGRAYDAVKLDPAYKQLFEAMETARKAAA